MMLVTSLAPLLINTLWTLSYSMLYERSPIEHPLSLLFWPSHCLSS